jgi:hypothetical protein
MQGSLEPNNCQAMGLKPGFEYTLLTGQDSFDYSCLLDCHQR